MSFGATVQAQPVKIAWNGSAWDGSPSCAKGPEGNMGCKGPWLHVALAHGGPREERTSYFLGCGWSFWLSAGHPCLAMSDDEVHGSGITMEFSQTTRCCWDRVIQPCKTDAECDLGGEGCIPSGTVTEKYGRVVCRLDTSPSRSTELEELLLPHKENGWRPVHPAIGHRQAQLYQYTLAAREHEWSLRGIGWLYSMHGITLTVEAPARPSLGRNFVRIHAVEAGPSCDPRVLTMWVRGACPQLSAHSARPTPAPASHVPRARPPVG